MISGLGYVKIKMCKIKIKGMWDRFKIVKWIKELFCLNFKSVTMIINDINFIN